MKPMAEAQRQIYRFNGCLVDRQHRRLLRDGRVVPLGAKAFDLLLVLLESDGRELSKEELLQKVWPEQFVEESNLTVHIAALRKALGERKDQGHYILTL